MPRDFGANQYFPQEVIHAKKGPVRRRSGAPIGLAQIPLETTACTYWYYHSYYGVRVLCSPAPNPQCGRDWGREIQNVEPPEFFDSSPCTKELRSRRFLEAFPGGAVPWICSCRADRTDPAADFFLHALSRFGHTLFEGRFWIQNSGETAQRYPFDRSETLTS